MWLNRLIWWTDTTILRSHVTEQWNLECDVANWLLWAWHDMRAKPTEPSWIIVRLLYLFAIFTAKQNRIEKKTSEMAGLCVFHWKSLWISIVMFTLLRTRVSVVSQDIVSTTSRLLKISVGFIALLLVGFIALLLVAVALLLIHKLETSSRINNTQKAMKLRSSSTIRRKCRGICWHVSPSSECLF